MKHLCFALLFLFSAHTRDFAQGKKNSNYLDPNSFSIALENNFFKGFASDSCYSGFHLLSIDFTNNDYGDIKILGSLHHYYELRLKELIKSQIKSLSKRDVLLFRNNRAKLFLPIFFDITTNCKVRNEFPSNANADSLMRNINRQALENFGLVLLAKQKGSIMSSYKELQFMNATKCLLLRPCYITVEQANKIM